jgi:hypothetical protein
MKISIEIYPKVNSFKSWVGRAKHLILKLGTLYGGILTKEKVL